MNAIKKARNEARKSLLGFIIITIIFYLIAWQLNKKNQWEFEKNAVSIWFWTIVIFCLISTYMSIQFYILTRRVASMRLKDYLLWFKYDNDDELIIGNQILIPYSKNIEKTHTKLTGVNWGLDNIKNAIDDLKEGSLPISLIIPTIHFSTNKLPVFIPLFKLTGERLYLYYIDIEYVKLLIIIISNGTSINDYFFSYPISKEINFNLTDFDQLQRDLTRKKINYEALHVTEEIIEQLKT